MNIQQLHYFLNICETKSLTKSAGLLFLTQPALSKSIASLEKELGASLFNKNNSGVTLTPYGEIFMVFAQNTLFELNEIKKEIETMQGIESSDIRVGFSHYMDSLFLSQLYNSFYDEYHESAISSTLLLQQYVNSAELTEALLSNKLDFAFMPVNVNLQKLKQDACLEYEIITNSSYVLYVSVAHPLAEFDMVDLGSLHGETIIINNEESFDVGSFMQAHNRIMLVKYDNSMVMGMIENGNWMFFAGDNLNFDSRRIKKLNIVSPCSSFDIAFVWEKRKLQKLPARQFRKCVLGKK